jgi:transposase
MDAARDARGEVSPNEAGACYLGVAPWTRTRALALAATPRGGDRQDGAARRRRRQGLRGAGARRPDVGHTHEVVALALPPDDSSACTVVTGASSPTGAALARELAHRGYDVFVVSAPADTLDDAAVATLVDELERRRAPPKSEEVAIVPQGEGGVRAWLRRVVAKLFRRSQE